MHSPSPFLLRRFHQLKIDLCGGEQYPHLNQSWIKFRKAFDECAKKRGSPIVMSVEYCGITHPDSDNSRYSTSEYHSILRNNGTLMQSSAVASTSGQIGGDPVTGCGSWIPALANLWRTNDDLQPEWASMYRTAQANDAMASIAGPGHWNDPGERPSKGL
jgi:hypothetical protein